MVGQIVMDNYQSNKCMKEIFSSGTYLFKFAQNEETFFGKDLQVFLERIVWGN